MPLDSCEALEIAFTKKSSKTVTVFSGADVFSACGADESKFQTLVGNSTRKVIFRHAAATSAVKWSDVLGQYEKKETSTSTGKGGLFGAGAMNTTNYAPKQTYRVAPDEIVKLRPWEVYLSDSQDPTIYQIMLQ